MFQIEQKKLKDRNDAAALLLEMVRPLKPMFSPGCAWLHVGNTAAHYGEKAARMEGFARVLWGLGALWGGGDKRLSPDLKKESEEWLAIYQAGLIHGTDPDHEEYWGSLNDYDQKMVEMASLAVAISLSPDKFWEPLTKDQKSHLYQWLNQINEKKVHPNNWRFFRILVNMTFCRLELPWSEACMEDDFNVIEGCYTREGWYYDGNPGQVDYYIPFAIQFYALIYAGFMEKNEPELSAKLKERAQEFSKTFIYWFGNDGNEIPFGRSLTYRFAHGAYFSAMGFAGMEGPGYGIMKNLALRNLETWMARPIFEPSGVLSIGYGYPNLYMSERYNAPGSPYWGFKTFFMLALPDDHPFWTSEPEAYPFDKLKVLSEPHMLVTHDEKDHVMAFVTGQHSKNHGYCQQKYEKFVYSNQFGFSVPRGHGLEEGAFDNTLAISLAGYEHYQMRYGTKEFRVYDDRLYMKYEIMPRVMVETTILPLAPWHVRIHRIHTEEAIDVADGGFAIEAEKCFHVVSGADSGKYEPAMVEHKPDSTAAVFPWGVSAAVGYTGGSSALVTAYPNTNLLYNLTVIPTVKTALEPGDHLVVTAFLGDRSELAKDWLDKRPKILLEEDKVTIGFQEQVKVWLKEL